MPELSLEFAATVTVEMVVASMNPDADPDAWDEDEVTEDVENAIETALEDAVFNMPDVNGYRIIRSAVRAIAL